jgi:hypothetical protein
VVTLKRCFTLGEMCVISEGAAIMVHKTQEMLYAAVSKNNKQQVNPHDKHSSFFSAPSSIVTRCLTISTPRKSIRKLSSSMLLSWE